MYICNCICISPGVLVHSTPPVQRNTTRIRWYFDGHYPTPDNVDSDSHLRSDTDSESESNSNSDSSDSDSDSSDSDSDSDSNDTKPLPGETQSNPWTVLLSTCRSSALLLQHEVQSYRLDKIHEHFTDNTGSPTALSKLLKKAWNATRSCFNNPNGEEFKTTFQVFLAELRRLWKDPIAKVRSSSEKQEEATANTIKRPEKKARTAPAKGATASNGTGVRGSSEKLAANTMKKPKKKEGTAPVENQMIDLEDLHTEIFDAETESSRSNIVANRLSGSTTYNVFSGNDYMDDE